MKVPDLNVFICSAIRTKRPRRQCHPFFTVVLLVSTSKSLISTSTSFISSILLFSLPLRERLLPNVFRRGTFLEPLFFRSVPVLLRPGQRCTGHSRLDSCPACWPVVTLDWCALFSISQMECCSLSLKLTLYSLVTTQTSYLVYKPSSETDDVSLCGFPWFSSELLCPLSDPPTLDSHRV